MFHHHVYNCGSVHFHFLFFSLSPPQNLFIYLYHPRWANSLHAFLCGSSLQNNYRRTHTYLILLYCIAGIQNVYLAIADPIRSTNTKDVGSVYRNWTVLWQFRLDQGRIVESLRYPCRHSFCRGDTMISGPMVPSCWGDLTDICAKTKSLLIAHGDHTNPKSSHMWKNN